MDPPDGDDAAFVQQYFSQFAAIYKQLDTGDDKIAQRFTSENAVLVLKKHSKKRDRARDPGVVERRAQRKRRVKALARKMSHRQLRADGLYDFELGERKYADFLFMNAMWEGYMARVLARHTGRGPPQADAVGPVLLKADLHGAYTRVTHSRSATHVGLAGIVLVERKNTFTLVCKDDRLRVVPKAGSVFALRTNGFLFTLYGDQLCVRTVERTIAKFKSSASIDL